MAKYGNSVSVALRALYPGIRVLGNRLFTKYVKDHEWLPWRFLRLPSSVPSTDNWDLVNRLMNHISTSLSVKDLQDWYRIGTVSKKNMDGYFN